MKEPTDREKKNRARLMRLSAITSVFIQNERSGVTTYTCALKPSGENSSGEPIYNLYEQLVAYLSEMDFYVVNASANNGGDFGFTVIDSYDYSKWLHEKLDDIRDMFEDEEEQPIEQATDHDAHGVLDE